MSLRILYLGLLAAALAAAGLRAGEPAGDEGPAVTLRTREGSLLRGFLHAADLVFEKDDGSTERLAWKDVWVVELAERIDAKEAEAARAAVAELASENYQIRQKAQKRLEDLGRGAAPALRAGAKSKDPEVAIRARELLAKMGGAGSAASGDHVQAVGARHPDGSAKDVRDLEGTVAADRYELRTAHGTIVLPAESVDGLKVLNAKDAAALLAAAKLWPAPGEKKVVGLVPARQALLQIPKSLAIEEEGVSELLAVSTQIPGHTTIGFKEKNDKGKEISEGDDLDEIFLSRGLRLKAIEDGRKVVAGKTHEQADGVLGAVVQGEDNAAGLECIFEDMGKPAGVLEVVVAAGPVDFSSLFIEAFDRKGQLVATMNLANSRMIDPPSYLLLNLKSPVPIQRLKVFKPRGEGQRRIFIRAISYSHLLAFTHDTRMDALMLASGEWLVGKFETVGEGKDRIAIRPAFLPKDAPSINVEVKDLFRIVPPLSDVEAGKEDDTPEPLDELPAPAPAVAPRTRPFIPHGILLQNGDRLLARLLKLDAESAVLELPGKVELKLPRAALRKVDLRPGTPPAPPPGDGEGEGEGEAKAKGDEKGEGDAKGEGEKKAEDKAAPPADPLDPEHVNKEKTGVEFAQRTASAAGKTSTEGLPRMDNAEILSIDTRKNALTVDPKDGGPPWPIDLHSARFLVFPEAPAPAAGNAGGWELTLRIGSRFAFELQSLDANGVRGKLAGGEVAMPWSAIESLVRTPPAKK